MPVTPTGILSLPLANLRTALSNVASFQAWVGAANAAEALGSIGLVERDDLARPFVVIDDGDEWSAAMIDAGASFMDEGDVVLFFEDDVAAEHQGSESDAQLAFTNAVGEILEDLIAYCGNNRDVFSIASVKKLFGPARSDDKERQAGEDYQQIGFVIGWR